jgi:hypothetical protein
LGRLTFAKAKAEPAPLEPAAFAQGLNTAASEANANARLQASLQSYAFLSSVGGVAFGTEAAGANGMKAVLLNYDRGAADGKRLMVTLEQGSTRRAFVAPIYDWQLVPIARFAATDQHACFTLFGKLTDAGEQEERLARGERILGYHPAFQDTLLGWRLMQSDILIIRPDACDLPSESGRYLLGAGEQRFLAGGLRLDIAAGNTAYLRLQQILERVPQRFTSYVICDYGQTVTFDVQRNSRELSLSGQPYWYCWRRKIDEPQALQQVQARANERANELLRAEYQRDLNQDAAQFNQKWTEAYQQQRFSKLFDEIVSANLIQPLPELSKTISATIPKLNGINPLVYDSLLTTMRYAALFRHVKQQDPVGFTRFVESLQAVKLVPDVETPSVMIAG